MDFSQIKEYWDQRASADNTVQSTTQDYYLREIEFRVLKNLIGKYNPASIMDVGCGDASTTVKLAADFPKINFIGIDYSESMLRNAQSNIERRGTSNLRVMLHDVTKSLPQGPCEMVYSTRCLINLSTWGLQQIAIKNISENLVVGGIYAMIENFIEGHENFNRVRSELGLADISVREHNLFFKRAILLDFVSNSFEVLQEENISSTYYLISRVIYSKLCQEAGVAPDYYDGHHKYAAQLPFCGEFGPVRMICLRKI